MTQRTWEHSHLDPKKLNIISLSNKTLVPPWYHGMSQSHLGCSQSRAVLFIHLIYLPLRLPRQTQTHTLKPLSIFNLCSQSPHMFQAESRALWTCLWTQEGFRKTLFFSLHCQRFSAVSRPTCFWTLTTTTTCVLENVPASLRSLSTH